MSWGGRASDAARGRAVRVGLTSYLGWRICRWCLHAASSRVARRQYRRELALLRAAYLARHSYGAQGGPRSPRSPRSPSASEMSRGNSLASIGEDGWGAEGAGPGSPGSAAGSEGTWREHPLRVMVLYASVGNGHKRAGEACVAALEELRDPNGLAPEVKCLDVVDFMSREGRFVYKSAFLTLTQSLAGQHMLGFFYDAQQDPSDAFQAGVKRTMNATFCARLVREVYAFLPDVIVNTHYLPADITAQLRGYPDFSVPSCTVVTDYDVQAIWVQDPTERYFVAREDVRLVLESFGVDRASTTVSGIPIMPEFRQAAEDAARDRAGVRRGLGLEEGGRAGGRPLVVVASNGPKSIRRTYPEILKAAEPMEVVVLMGRQADTRDELLSVSVPDRHKVHLWGFTSKMPQLLACADLFVGKPGGLTVAEALALGVPMLITDPIPGQESRNADMLLEMGAGVKVSDPCLLAYRLDGLLGQRGARLRRMRDAIAESGIGRPVAAQDVARWALAAGAMHRGRVLRLEPDEVATPEGGLATPLPKGDRILPPSTPGTPREALLF